MVWGVQAVTRCKGSVRSLLALCSHPSMQRALAGSTPATCDAQQGSEWKGLLRRSMRTTPCHAAAELLASWHVFTPFAPMSWRQPWSGD